MRAKSCSHWGLVLWMLAVTISTTAGTRNSGTARRCGIDQDLPAQRIFADSDGKHGWREYRSVKDVPEIQLDAGGAFAWLWAGRDGHVLIRIEEPGEDFSAYTDYCFSKNGQLEQLRFELWTAWGWGYREEGPIANGALAPQTLDFFSTENEEPITKPDQADDIHDALRPHLYLRKSQLPFARLLHR